VGANPRDALVVTLAAHEAEGRGDLAGAERLLLLAEVHNRLWLPRWTLANFYFRHDRMEDFWKWVRAALERSQGNLAPVFRMCEEAGGDAAFLLEKVIPGEPRVLAGYISFLAERGRLEGLGAAAGSFLDHQTAESREWAWRVVNVAIEGLLKGGRGEEARGLWNRMSRVGLIGYPELDSERPLVNGDLEEPLAPAGFDWRVGRAAGVESYFGSPTRSAKFVLTGRQPERMTLMAQTVWLEAGRRYRLTFETQWIGDAARARGVVWRVAGRAAGWSPAAEDWAVGAVEVAAAPEERAVEIALAAEREVGQVRPEGELRVRRVRLEAVK
jgi:pentatricopeptide repeat protein